MKQYRAKEDCFVHVHFYKAGEIFEHEGKPFHFMEEVDEDGKPLKPAKGSKEAKEPAAPVPSKDALQGTGKEAI